MQKIIFFGSGEYTIPIIKLLHNKGLQLVVTTEKEGPFVKFVQSNSIPLFITDFKNKDDIKKITELKPDVGVLASYGAILPREILNLFPHGILNIHPSLLPKYRGPSPIQSTILSGDKVTGVTIIRLDDKVDHGPILAQQEVPLLGRETKQYLKEYLFALGASLIEKLIQQLENDEARLEIEQDHDKATMTKKVTRESGKINLEQPPTPEELDKMIRAYYEWPGVWFEITLMGKTRRVKLLPEEKIQVEGKNVMSYKDFINGYGKEGKELLQKLNIFN